MTGRKMKPDTIYRLYSYVLCTLQGLFLACCLSEVQAAPKTGSEAWYQKIWCEGKNGQLEYKLNNSSRADCLTPKYAIEMDFAHKWHEAIGQSLSYAKKTKRKAGIVLILRSEKDRAFLLELQKTIRYFHLPITVWKIESWG